MFGEALKTNEKESYDLKIEISAIGIPDTSPPPPLKGPNSLPEILIILSEFYCGGGGGAAHKSPLNFFPRSAPDANYTFIFNLLGIFDVSSFWYALWQQTILKLIRAPTLTKFSGWDYIS